MKEYRGKRLDNGQWTYGAALTAPGGAAYIIESGNPPENWYVWHEIDPATVGRDTGLLDIHKKKIYKGDIVKWGHMPHSEEHPVRIAAVELNPDIQFRILNQTDFKGGRCSNFRFGCFIYTDTHNHLEVIGTTHDAPGGDHA